VEAPDGLAEMTVAEIDEQRRQEEAGRANRVYALPMDPDGPRFDDPVTDRFASEIPDDLAVNLKTAKALMLTVDEGNGCRFRRWRPFRGGRGAPGVASDDAGVGAEGSETDAILGAVS
jgi:hypothetical protein